MGESKVIEEEDDYNSRNESINADNKEMLLNKEINIDNIVKK